MKRHIKFQVFGAMAVLLAVVVVHAQGTSHGMHMVPLYRSGTEITIKGTVEGVDQVTRKMRTGAGTHLTVKTPRETIMVMLGPSNFIAGQGFTFATGDDVEVTGSKVTMGVGESLIAREVIKGGKTLTLRDKNGTPEWAGKMTGGQ